MFDEHYARAYDALNDGKDYIAEAAFVYNWAGRPRTILDLGCGTARHWQYYPPHVLMRGIDASRNMRGQAGKPNHITIGDIRDIEYGLFAPFECVTALYDVVNYVDDLSWVDRLPLKRGKFFIFDIWDYDKIKRDGFEKRRKAIKGFDRTITPHIKTKRKVLLDVQCNGMAERHDMTLWTLDDINACATKYNLTDIKFTSTWQLWVKLQRK